MTNKKGFTLIELLIVIAIIGILAAALIPNILNAPAAARDTARISALNDIVTAMEQYYTSTGSYPTTKTCLTATTPANFGSYFKNGVPSNTVKLTIGGLTLCDYAYFPLTAGGSYAIVTGVEKAGTDVKRYANVSLTAAPTTGAALTGATLPASGANQMYVIN